VRLFVAVEIAPLVAAAASALSDLLRRRAGRLAPDARITWIPTARLHITVRFIGNADDARTDAIRAALEPPLRVEPFDLVLAGSGAFPRAGAPRVLWAGVSAGGESLDKVEREVTARLQEVGVAPEPRDYRPHLTLARIRDAAGLTSSRLCEGLADQMVGTTRVEAITLFESRLSPKGPTYVPLRRTPLRRV
jgi:2'-5' RNA ligase